MSPTPTPDYLCTGAAYLCGLGFAAKAWTHESFKGATHGISLEVAEGDERFAWTEYRVGVDPFCAQTHARSATMKAPIGFETTPAPAGKVIITARLTSAQAASDFLDLFAFPRWEGGKIAGPRSLASLSPRPPAKMKP